MAGSKEKQLFTETDDEAAIHIPADVDAHAIEFVLKVAYQRSLRNKYRTLRFDLSDLQFITLYPLAIITLWIWELRDREKHVDVTMPDRSSVAAFLGAYGFTQFTKKYDVTVTEMSDAQTEEPRSRDHLVAPYFPLTLFTDTAFRRLLADLYKGNRVATVLEHVGKRGIVATGAITAL